MYKRQILSFLSGASIVMVVLTITVFTLMLTMQPFINSLTFAFEKNGIHINSVSYTHLFRVGIKPTPSISQVQQTVNIKTKENTELEIIGRHDPCIVPRAVVVVESMAALGILDMMKDI